MGAETFNVNVTGALPGLPGVLCEPSQSSSAAARIINIVSLNSYVSLREVAAYAASKWARAPRVDAQPRRYEWSAEGINVNAIAPGVFRTDLNKNLLDSTDRGKELLMRTPDEALRPNRRVERRSSPTRIRRRQLHHRPMHHQVDGGIPSVRRQHARPVKVGSPRRLRHSGGSLLRGGFAIIGGTPHPRRVFFGIPLPSRLHRPRQRAAWMRTSINALSQPNRRVERRAAVLPSIRRRQLHHRPMHHRRRRIP